MGRPAKSGKNINETIFLSLLKLLEQKELGQITITELVNTAGISRTSYYRKFSSKEEVIHSMLRYSLEQYDKRHHYDPTQYASYDNILYSMKYLKIYKKYLLILYRSGFSDVILDEFNQFHESIAGIMSANSMNRYQLYLYIGALYNIGFVWLQEEEPEPIEDMVHIIQRYMKKQFVEREI